MIGQSVSKREKRFHRGEMKRGIIEMSRQLILEHLMADFAKDEVLAMKLSFWIDVDSCQ